MREKRWERDTNGNDVQFRHNTSGWFLPLLYLRRQLQQHQPTQSINPEQPGQGRARPCSLTYFFVSDAPSPPSLSPFLSVSCLFPWPSWYPPPTPPPFSLSRSQPVPGLATSRSVGSLCHLQPTRWKTPSSGEGPKAAGAAAAAGVTVAAATGGDGRPRWNSGGPPTSRTTTPSFRYRVSPSHVS